MIYVHSEVETATRNFDIKIVYSKLCHVNHDCVRIIVALARLDQADGRRHMHVFFKRFKAPIFSTISSYLVFSLCLCFGCNNAEDHALMLSYCSCEEYILVVLSDSESGGICALSFTFNVQGTRSFIVGTSVAVEPLCILRIFSWLLKLQTMSVKRLCNASWRNLSPPIRAECAARGQRSVCATVVRVIAKSPPVAVVAPIRCVTRNSCLYNSRQCAFNMHR